jgi:hypothetical protein
MMTALFAGRVCVQQGSCLAPIFSTRTLKNLTPSSKKIFVFMPNSWCLQSWLEQDPSCPTCRLTLSIGETNSSGNAAGSSGVVGLLGNVLGGLVGSMRDHDTLDTDQREQPQQMNNNAQVFHFDGKYFDILVDLYFTSN